MPVQIIIAYGDYMSVGAPSGRYVMKKAVCCRCDKQDTLWQLKMADRQAACPSRAKHRKCPHPASRAGPTETHTFI